MGIDGSEKEHYIDPTTKLWLGLIKDIAHDLTTPVARLLMVERHLEKVLPELLECYTLAIDNKSFQPKLSEELLKITKEHTVPSFLSASVEMCNFLKQLQLYHQFLGVPSERILSIKDFIKKSIKNYPFEDEQDLNLVQLNCLYDFTIESSTVFLNLFFEHLLQNSIRAIHQAGKGGIIISTQEDEKYNIIHFKYTALGMMAQLQDQVFDRFFSKRNNNVVPGMGFCKLALLLKGCEILFETKEDEYAEFILMFPKKSKVPLTSDITAKN